MATKQAKQLGKTTKQGKKTRKWTKQTSIIIVKVIL